MTVDRFREIAYGVTPAEGLRWCDDCGLLHGPDDVQHRELAAARRAAPPPPPEPERCPECGYLYTAIGHRAKCGAAPPK